ncbi:hypothetical protein MHU86_25621 [Fragilaria crotonensis]|nr:hypothetical protein MHU86_25621 [Fragilaria crotonensis]
MKASKKNLPIFEDLVTDSKANLGTHKLATFIATSNSGSNSCAIEPACAYSRSNNEAFNFNANDFAINISANNLDPISCSDDPAGVTTELPALRPETSCCLVEAKPKCPNKGGCEVGTWTCPASDGTYVCNSRIVFGRPLGQVCNKCCIEQGRLPCPSGNYACCSDGTAQCPDPSSGLYSCGTVKVKQPQGHTCCCDGDSEISCGLGAAVCCGDGTWQCPQLSPCPFTTGEVCRNATPWKYVEPVWWNTVSKGKNVQRCGRRKNAPVNGSPCGSKDKPSTECKCIDGGGRKKGQWSCRNLYCTSSQN